MRRSSSLRLLVNGYGRVGRAFVALVLARRDELRATYGVDLAIAGITTRTAAWLDTGGVANSLSSVVDRAQAGARLEELTDLRGDDQGLWAIGHVAADVLVEATPSDLNGGAPAAGHLRAAVDRGWHVATAAKGGVVHELRSLRALARTHGREVRIGAATAAALPTVDLVEFCLAGTRITRIDGILNGSSNYVLTEMSGGRSYQDALADAQRRGIAEADPRLDMGGFDTASKLVLIANTVWDDGISLNDVLIRGVEEVTAKDLSEAVANGGALKLVGTASQTDGRVTAAVCPVTLPLRDPLAHVRGPEKGATFTTDTMDRVTVTGGKSDPLGAAAALLRDVLHIAQSAS